MDYFTLFYEYLYVDFIESILKVFFNFLNTYFYNNVNETAIEDIDIKHVCLSITDINNQFMDKEKERFIEMFSNENIKWNENVNNEFYNINIYKKSTEFENGDFEIEWKKRTLLQNTPRGNIIMYYDVYKKGFAYYCDQQSIPYIILNTMAMRYVRLFMCRDLFIDDNIDSQCSPSPLINLEKKEEKKDIVEKNSSGTSNELKEKLKSGPFAKLKKYNQTTTKLEDVSLSLKPKQENIEKNKNRFLYMGKMLNYDFITKINKKSKINNMLFNSSGSGIYNTMFEKEHALQMNVLNYSEYKKKLQEEKVI